MTYVISNKHLSVSCRTLDLNAGKESATTRLHMLVKKAAENNTIRVNGFEYYKTQDVLRFMSDSPHGFGKKFGPYSVDKTIYYVNAIDVAGHVMSMPHTVRVRRKDREFLKSLVRPQNTELYDPDKGFEWNNKTPKYSEYGLTFDMLEEDIKETVYDGWVRENQYSEWMLDGCGDDALCEYTVVVDDLCPWAHSDYKGYLSPQSDRCSTFEVPERSFYHDETLVGHAEPTEMSGRRLLKLILNNVDQLWDENTYGVVSVLREYVLDYDSRIHCTLWDLIEHMIAVVARAADDDAEYTLSRYQFEDEQESRDARYMPNGTYLHDGEDELTDEQKIVLRKYLGLDPYYRCSETLDLLSQPVPALTE